MSPHAAGGGDPAAAHHHPSHENALGELFLPDRTDTLNLNLVKAPPACLDYVIIHELCHIKVRHHGPDFWRMVSRYRPDYLSERRQLKHYT